jgi:hypothetical protein
MSDLPASTRAGHFLAKILGIQVDYRREVREDQSISSSETFVDREPTAKEWLSKFTPTTAATKAYVLSLFPFLQWIFHYNLQWLTGDLIAGKSLRNSWRYWSAGFELHLPSEAYFCKSIFQHEK